jgi:hypothetical protein
MKSKTKKTTEEFCIKRGKCLGVSSDDCICETCRKERRQKFRRAKWKPHR